jgi:hypothetical protein
VTRYARVRLSRESPIFTPILPSGHVGILRHGHPRAESPQRPGSPTCGKNPLLVAVDSRVQSQGVADRNESLDLQGSFYRRDETARQGGIVIMSKTAPPLTTSPVVSLLALILMSLPFGSSLGLDLDRPRPVVEIRVSSTDPPDEQVRSVLQQLVTAAGKAGYRASESVQWSEGYFEAVKEESPVTHHRVLIWLGWGLRDPGKLLVVYLNYAKFHKYAGESWQMELTNEKEQDHATQGLREELFKAAQLR